MMITSFCLLQIVVEERKNGLVGNLALAPVLTSMVTQSAWIPLVAKRLAVAQVTWFCRMERVSPGKTVAANTPTTLLLVRSGLC